MFGAAWSCIMLCTNLSLFNSKWQLFWQAIVLTAFIFVFWWCSTHLRCPKTVFRKRHPGQSHGAALVMPAAWVNPARGINTSCEGGKRRSCRNNKFLKLTVKAATFIIMREQSEGWLMRVHMSENHLVFSSTSVSLWPQAMWWMPSLPFSVSVLWSFCLPLLDTVADSRCAVSSLISQYASDLSVHLFPCYLIVINHEKHTEKTSVYLKSILRFHQSASLAARITSGQESGLCATWYYGCQRLKWKVKSTCFWCRYTVFSTNTISPCMYVSIVLQAALLSFSWCGLIRACVVR